jgi:hypothetical protein
MGFSSSSLRLFVGACMVAGMFAESVRADGVIGGGAFMSDSADVSLVGQLGDATLSSDLPSKALAPASNSLIAARPASPQERVDAQMGTDLFPNLRIALPLVVVSTVGAPVEASLATSVRPMSGPMVGVRPHPSTWGSALGR